MTGLKNILVATDLGDCSQAAIGQALGLAERFDANLHLLYVVTDPLHETWACYAPGASFMEVVEELEREARTQIERAVDDPERIAQGRVVVATSWGDPSDEILKYARDREIDLIVCGTHGRRGWDYIMMGSVAERVVRYAPCPVLTVHAASTAVAAAA